MLLTIAEVAKELKTNVTYVHRLRKAGLLPCIKLGTYKVRKEALEEFLKKYEGHDLTDPESVLIEEGR
jgi:excisionase family DNA binding protein